MPQPSVVNTSIVYAEVPLLERPARARAQGFGTIESWWPFPGAVPGDREADAFVASVLDAGVSLIALNLHGGDKGRGEKGIPARGAEFAEGVAAALEIGDRLGTRMHNMLVGRGPLSDTTVERLAAAAATAHAGGSTLLVEPLSGVEDYPVTTTAAALDLVARLGPGTGVLADLYHLAVNGEDVDAAIAAHGHAFTHVQIADAPGRGAPGTGALPIGRWLAALDTAGYPGAVALEHRP